MEHEITGTTMPVLTITLQPSERIIAISGELSWMTETINLNTSTQHGGGGGLFGALKRVVAGGSLFMTEYSAGRGPGSVSFAAKIPGHIVPLEVRSGTSYLVHRHGFLCSTPSVELSLGFQQSLGAGIFGGEGFFLQRISGQGLAWIEVGGELISYDLAPGQNLRVHPAHIGAFEESVNFEITRLRGISNLLFGNDGLFLVSLTGPGRVWLQTLTMPNFAHALAPYLPREQK